jgi:uncharacterized membrane protein
LTDQVAILASFLLAFKAVLLEGSEVAILSVATMRQLGKNNVLLGVASGGLASFLIFVAVTKLFSFLPEALIDVGTGLVILYFSYRFLRGFKRYYFGKKDFRAKMKKLEDEVVEREFEKYGAERPGTLPFSMVNALPVFSITLTEGFEASLVVGAAGTINFEWTLIGAAASLLLIIVISAVSYEYLMTVPRWALDLLAGCILLTFGSYFLGSGIYMLAFGGGLA